MHSGDPMQSQWEIIHKLSLVIGFVVQSHSLRSSVAGRPLEHIVLQLLDLERIQF